MFKVYDKCCKQCLIGSNKIVGNARRDEIISGCLADGTHFVCHKASMKGDDICCAGFYAKHKNDIQKLQVFERIGMVQQVPQTQDE